MSCERNSFKSFVVITVLLVSYIGVTCVFYDLDRQRRDRAQLKKLDTGAYDISLLSSEGREAFRAITHKLTSIGVRRPTHLAAVIAYESEKRGFDPLFVAAVIYRESTFNTRAVSNRGARGLMQLLPSTAKYIAKKENLEWKGAEALFHPAYNIRLGIAYLQYLESGFDGKARLVLMAYNWGPGNLKGALAKNVSPFKSVRSYADKVLGTYQDLRDFIV